MKHWWVPGLQIGYEHTFIHQFADFLEAAAKADALRADLPRRAGDGLRDRCGAEIGEDEAVGERSIECIVSRESVHNDNDLVAYTSRATFACLLRHIGCRRASSGPGVHRWRSSRRGRSRQRRRDAGEARPPAVPEPLPFEDHAGFDSIFDGKTLKGWDGDPKFWRAEDGAIVGQTTADKQLKENTFIIWRGGEPADFELKVEYRINATNSGIQIRSVQLPRAPDAAGRGAVAGQLGDEGLPGDIDAAQPLHRTDLRRARPRLSRHARPDDVLRPMAAAPKVVGSAPATARRSEGIIKVNDWNQAHVIARGNMITEILNGHVTSIARRRRHEGPRVEGTARLPDSCRRADEGRVQEHLAEEALSDRLDRRPGNVRRFDPWLRKPNMRRQRREGVLDKLPAEGVGSPHA